MDILRLNMQFLRTFSNFTHVIIIIDTVHFSSDKI